MEKSCLPDILHEDDHNRVTYCSHCQNLQVEAGNVLFSLSYEEFGLLSIEIKKLIHHFTQLGLHAQCKKRLLFPLHGMHLFLSYTLKDYQKLLEVMEVSEFMLETKNILTS